jgi:hypothetical protein
MATSFSHSPNGLVLTTARTLIYGPVPAGQTAIVYSGLFSNLDTATRGVHSFVLERYNGTSYQNLFQSIPVPFGGASKCPKVTLLAGETLYGTADAAAVVGASVEVMIRS